MSAGKYIFRVQKFADGAVYEVSVERSLEKPWVPAY